MKSSAAVLSHTLLFLLAPAAVAAAQSGQSWEKTYPVSGIPTLRFQVGDSNLHVHACSGCKAVRARITVTGATLSDYILEEGQEGDAVHLALREKPHIGFHMTFHRSAVIDVETPAAVHLEATSSDGALAVEDLHGSFSLKSSDGAETLHRIAGDLHLQTSDGNITVQQASGNLEARTSDGHLEAVGTFSALQVHSSDGPIRINLAQGSRLSAPSAIQSSDGSVTLQVPGSFPAELDLHTGDGRIESGLPLAVDGISSHGSHNIHGKLDGGGAPLTIHTDDGTIHLSRS